SRRRHTRPNRDWSSDVCSSDLACSPLDMTALFGEQALGETDGTSISVRYLTPHNKWAIHSMYQENFFMMNLSRGGQNIWMSVEEIGRASCRERMTYARLWCIVR